MSPKRQGCSRWIRATTTSTAKKFVALVGVEDLVIVETEDALLIAHRKHSQDVGKIVKELASSGQTELI
jgi:mannose-1-phosphate guanylyltransferase